VLLTVKNSFFVFFIVSRVREYAESIQAHMENMWKVFQRIRRIRGTYLYMEQTANSGLFAVYKIVSMYTENVLEKTRKVFKRK
jgi:hypothetical protein